MDFLKKISHSIVWLLGMYVRAIVVVMVVAVLAVAWLLIVSQPVGTDSAMDDITNITNSVVAMPSPAGSESGWGSEALYAVDQETTGWSPIPLANACGAGASTCFKCHNGRRAMAPTMDKQRGPWHVDHKLVNQSCAGCHHGNPRIIKKEIAHIELITDPRMKSEVCATCHKPKDVANVLKGYQKIAQQ